MIDSGSPVDLNRYIACCVDHRRVLTATIHVRHYHCTTTNSRLMQLLGRLAWLKNTNNPWAVLPQGHTTCAKGCSLENGRDRTEPGQKPVRVRDLRCCRMARKVGGWGGSEGAGRPGNWTVSVSRGCQRVNLRPDTNAP